MRPTPIIAVAVTALVVGLAAPAAASEARSLISGSQIKNHSITGEKLANNTVTGRQVKESTLGTVPSAVTASHAPLPTVEGPGQSEQGVWAFADDATQTLPVETAISFAVPFAQRLTTHIIAAAATAPTGCSGTAAAPTAAPGNLCIFVGFDVGYTTIHYYDPTSGAINRTSDYGVVLTSHPGADSDSEASGTWAATASAGG